MPFGLANLSSPSVKFASTAVFLSASIWGLYWIPIRYLEDNNFDAFWAIALLNLPAAIALAIPLFYRWEKNSQFLIDAFWIGVFSGLGLALYAAGLVYTTVVRATLLFYLTPVWGTLIGLLWLGERALWQRWLAIILGLAGLMLLVSGFGSASLNIGDLFGLLSGISWAVAASLIKRFDQVPLVSMTLFQFLFTALVALTIGLILGDLHLPDIAGFQSFLPMTTVISLVFLLPAVCVLFWAQKFLFPGRVGLLMMSEVLVAVISASLLLPDERMAALEWVGAALIISACLLEVMSTTETELS